MHFIFPRLILISDKKNESWRQMMSHRALSTKFATRRNQAERITQKRLIEAMFRETLNNNSTFSLSRFGSGLLSTRNVTSRI